MAQPRARIYRPAKTAMQSGRGNTKSWVLEFAPAAPKAHDPLMGWVSSSDTRGQVRLRFASKEEALAYAKRRNLAVEVEEPRERRIRPKSYADNFRWQPPV
ncbi:MAG: ETC complex I subunit [Alphaproteobacteria bacterium]|nr:ETC complex I subunit [Alphaproteobacteria bacterium]